MIKRIALFIAMQIIFFAGKAQQNNAIDSLQKLLTGKMADSLKSKTYYQLAKLYTDAQDSANAVNSYLKVLR